LRKKLSSGGWTQDGIRKRDMGASYGKIGKSTKSGAKGKKNP